MQEKLENFIAIEKLDLAFFFSWVSWLGIYLVYVCALVQASHTPPRFGGSSRLFGELCKYGFDSSGKGGTGASPGTHSYPWNKQTNMFVPTKSD